MQNTSTYFAVCVQRVDNAFWQSNHLRFTAPTLSGKTLLIDLNLIGGRLDGTLTVCSNPSAAPCWGWCRPWVTRRAVDWPWKRAAVRLSVRLFAFATRSVAKTTNKLRRNWLIVSMFSFWKSMKHDTSKWWPDLLTNIPTYTGGLTAASRSAASANTFTWRSASARGAVRILQQNWLFMDFKRQFGNISHLREVRIEQVSFLTFTFRDSKLEQHVSIEYHLTTVIKNQIALLPLKAS